MIERSICSTVASPAATMWSASRQSASCNRLAMKPGTSRSMVITDLPMWRKKSEVHATTSGEVFAPPTTSTSGIRYGGLNGCPTTVRSGWAHATCISLMPKPEVELEMTMPSGAAASMSASSCTLSSSTSGALSCTNCAPASAFSRSGS